MLEISGLGDLETTGQTQESAGSEESFVITQFTPGAHDPNRVNVFINHHFAFSLDMSQIVNLRVKIGQRLTAEQFQELQKASEFGKLYQRALEWALTRPHSIRETRDYLRRRQLKRNQTNQRRVQEDLKPLPELQDEAIELVLKRLVEKGYVDDQKFAEHFVENRFTKKGASKKRLRIELYKKGVSEDIIENALFDSPRDERDEILKVIEKKWRKYDRQKLLQYLVRQGFNYQDALDAIMQFDARDD